MGFVENLTSVLTFNKDGMGELANDDGATVPAILIALLGSILSSIPLLLDYFNSDAAGKEVVLAALIFAFSIQFLILFILAGIMGFTLRGFGGSATLIQSLRVYGFALVWGLIGGVLDTVLDFVNFSAQDSFGFSLGFLLGLVGLVAFIVGLTSFSGLGIGSAFFAVIIAYIIAVILVVIIAFILGLLLIAVIVSII